MALVSTRALMYWPGVASGDGGIGIATNRTCDAAGEYDGYVIMASEDMTISHVGIYVTITGATAAEVRIETVSAADGFPTGTLWAANTNIGIGTLVAGWTLHTLTAAASITRGQLFAVRINWVSGSAFVTRSCTIQRASGVVFPYEVYNIGSPIRAQTNLWYPWVLGSSATTFYYVDPFWPMSLGTSASFDVNSILRGARFKMPFPCRCIGMRSIQATGMGDINALLMDDSGAELGNSNTAFSGIQKCAIAGSMEIYFDNPVILYPGTWYRAAMQPTTVTDIRFDYATLPSADYIAASPGGANFYFAEFATGTWTDSPDKVPQLDLILDQVGDGRDSPTYAVAI